MLARDAQAFVQIAYKVQRSELTICASTVAREEIDKIPAEYRQDHLDEYNALRIVQGSNATWLDDDPGSTDVGTVVEHPEYHTLREILPDEDDARHLFQAKMAGVDNVVTVDYKSILNRAGELEQRAGIRAFSPSQYVAQWST